MKLMNFSRHLFIVSTIFMVAGLSPQAFATTVQVQTSVGNFEINLFDFDVADPDEVLRPDLKPTVENFLAYVIAGRYDNTYFHRLAASPHVIQGGGFVYNGMMPEPQPDPLPAAADSEPGIEAVVLNAGEDNPTIDNQPRFSNVRGTIAMAKGSDPDSASNQWFINLSDNAGGLDTPFNAGGFTVFGRVMGDGMDVVDALAGFTLLSTPASPESGVRYTYNAPLGQLPVQMYDATNFAANVAPTDSNLAMITSIIVLDSTINTEVEADLIVNEVRLGFRANPVVNNDQYKGGNIGLVFLTLLSALLFYRRRFQ